MLVSIALATHCQHWRLDSPFELPSTEANSHSMTWPVEESGGFGRGGEERRGEERRGEERRGEERRGEERGGEGRGGEGRGGEGGGEGRGEGRGGEGGGEGRGGGRGGGRKMDEITLSIQHKANLSCYALTLALYPGLVRGDKSGLGIRLC